MIQLKNNELTFQPALILTFVLCRNLEYLDLSHNNVTNVSMEQLALDVLNFMPLRKIAQVSIRS